MSVYANADAQRIRSGGGAVRVTLSSGVGQGNDGTSLPCAGCYVQTQLGNTELVYLNIGAAASSSLGIELCEENNGQPMWIPTDDVSNLYFYSEDTDAKVDILYFKGA